MRTYTHTHMRTLSYSVGKLVAWHIVTLHFLLPCSLMWASILHAYRARHTPAPLPAMGGSIMIQGVCEQMDR